LFGRILLQDLKQAIARRERGRDHRPTMIVIDEFAALREPEQIQDLLLQARSAGAAIVLSSQFLPRDETLNAAVKGAGLLLALRTTEEDAQHVAGMIGTEKAISMTTQTTNPNLFDTSGTTGMGSVRNVERYLFHPNLIKQLPDAAAVLKLDRPKLGRMETVIRIWQASTEWKDNMIRFPGLNRRIEARALPQPSWRDRLARLIDRESPLMGYLLCEQCGHQRLLHHPWAPKMIAEHRHCYYPECSCSGFEEPSFEEIRPRRSGNSGG
ncbi:MAG: type IV secretion system DNA-binding domain-containing protein, partial [Candidatus Dormibacteraceae bacterium]